MSIRRSSSLRQRTFNITKYGEDYKVVPNNVIGSTDKFVLYYQGVRLGRFAEANDAYKARDEHIKERKKAKK